MSFYKLRRLMFYLIQQLLNLAAEANGRQAPATEEEFEVVNGQLQQDYEMIDQTRQDIHNTIEKLNQLGKASDDPQIKANCLTFRLGSRRMHGYGEQLAAASIASREACRKAAEFRNGLIVAAAPRDRSPSPFDFDDLAEPAEPLRRVPPQNVRRLSPPMMPQMQQHPHHQVRCRLSPPLQEPIIQRGHRRGLDLQQPAEANFEREHRPQVQAQPAPPVEFCSFWTIFIAIFIFIFGMGAILIQMINWEEVFQNISIFSSDALHLFKFILIKLLKSCIFIKNYSIYYSYCIFVYIKNVLIKILLYFVIQIKNLIVLISSNYYYIICSTFLLVASVFFMFYKIGKMTAEARRRRIEHQLFLQRERQQRNCVFYFMDHEEDLEI